MKKWINVIVVVLLLQVGQFGFIQASHASSLSATVSVSSTQLDSAVPLQNFKNMGVNFEMSKTSDEMWSSNGKWMEQTYASSGIKMIRWGYDAWVFDWENEVPLNTNYQGGMNTKDDEGSYGLREFLLFAKEYDIIPFLHLPVESWNHNNGKSDPTYKQVLQLATNMATYLNNNGFETVYFDMGNEPMYAPSNPYGTFSAATYGSMFKDFYTTIKAINPNYKIVMMASDISWYNGVKATAREGSTLYFDAIDYHNYPSNNVGWNLYYARNDDNIFGSFGTIDAGIEKILGEANIPWPDFPTYSTSLGSGLALLNGFLKLAHNDDYSSVIMWPSQWPSNDTTYQSFNPSGQSFGWFDQDAWYDSKSTVRLNGPMIAEMIAQKMTLSHKVNSSSTDSKLRTFAFTNTDQSELNVIVINKHKEDLDLTLNVPSDFNYVKASVFKGEKDATGAAHADLSPDFKGHIMMQPLVSGTFVDHLNYGESALIYTFYKDTTTTLPTSFDMTLPFDNATKISTAQNFTWQSAYGATNYEIIISKQSDLSLPVIKTTTNGLTNYQPMHDLDYSTSYYWSVRAFNKNGDTVANSGVRQFTTVNERHFYDDDHSSIQYMGSWTHQNYLGAFGRKDHGTSSPGAKATITFTGTQAIFYGIKDDWIRKISVSINGGTPQTIDLYRDRGIMAFRVDDPARYSRGSGETDAQKIARLNGIHATQEVIFNTGILSHVDQTHTVEITVLNEYNPAITKSWKGFELDYYEVIREGETALQTSAQLPNLLVDLPETLNVNTGDSIVLEVNATSTDGGYLNYEWYKDGVLLSETSNQLTISNSDITHAGQYYAKVTNVYRENLTKTTTSSTTLVTVTAPTQNLKFKAKHSGSYIDVFGSHTTDGVDIIQWSSTSNLNQQWTIENTSDSFYKIIAAHSGKALAVAGGSRLDGAELEQTTYTADTDYRDEWKFVSDGNGYVTIINRQSGKAIDVPGASLSNGVQLIQWLPSPVNHQKFELVWL